jgi:hypothetical protein
MRKDLTQVGLLRSESAPGLRVFTQRCVIPITNSMVIGTTFGRKGLSGQPGCWPAHPKVAWMVFNNADREKGFSKRVMPRFNISRSAINSPV